MGKLYTIGIYPMEETLKKLLWYDSHGVKYAEFSGFSVRTNSHRYPLFYQNPRCVWCGALGVELRLQYTKSNRHQHLLPGESVRPAAHFNLFAADGRLLTKDHIKAYSKGGRNFLENFQTMCESCNVAKGVAEAPISRIQNRNLMYNDEEREEQLKLVDPKLRLRFRPVFIEEVLK